MYRIFNCNSHFSPQQRFVASVDVPSPDTSILNNAVQGAGVADAGSLLAPLLAAVDGISKQQSDTITGLQGTVNGLVSGLLKIVGGALKLVLNLLGDIAPASKVAQDLQSITNELTSNLGKAVGTVVNVTLAIPQNLLSNGTVSKILNDTVDGVVKCLDAE